MFARISTLLCLTLLLRTTTAAASNPFEFCPSKAFIVQSPGSVPILYGVDLAIGSYTTLSSDMGTSKVNGAGFNYHDSYLYGWDYGAGTLARFGNDYQAVPLNLTSIADKPFYVGDVSVVENDWYCYRKGYGLYRVDLSDPDAKLVMEKIATHISMGNPNLTDLAFHPFDGLIYAVDNDGFLMTIDPANGETNVLVQVLSEAQEGFNFTFGAQYFDVNENLYLSNNSNGFIYRVTLDGVDSEAVFFTYGPSSNSNDGARCALAEIEISDQIDFGDAPDSYSSTLANAGAKHGISSLYLGSLVDGESDAYFFPLSDDVSDQSDGDDGITFPTGFEIDSAAIIIASVTGSGGFLNAWIDWDQDGKFEDDEQITTALAVTEVGVITCHYPSESGFTSFAFEDLYPKLGDFDMNDVLMNVRYTEYVKDGQVIRIKLEGQVAALGGSYRNGFGIMIQGVDPTSIKDDSIAYFVNYVRQSDSSLEENRNNAVLVASQNLWNITQPGEGGCKYFRVEEGCGTSSRPNWQMTVPLRTPVDVNSMPAMPYDPFILAAPGNNHGTAVSTVTGKHPGRKFEVHLKNRAPSNAFDVGLFGTFDDASDTQQATFF